MNHYPSPTSERFKMPLVDLVELPLDQDPIDKPVRGITPDTYRKYGVAFHEGGIMYPYRTGGKTVGYKVRHKGKRFPWVGELSGVTMFTPTTQTSGNRHLILTEGEQDAMAFHQMTGYTAWSVPFGATSATKYVKRALRELEIYDNIYIAFDNDSEGNKAADAVMDLLDPTKAKRVSFPPGVKDANDLLRNWEEAPTIQGVHSAGEYAMHLVWGAQAPLVDGVVDIYTAVDEAQEWYFNREARVGLTTGYDSLNTLIGGWRGGELLVVVGGTGSSKSTTSRQLLMRQVEQGVPTGYITLEDTVPLAITRLLEIQQRRELVRGDEPRITRNEYQAASETLSSVHLVDGFRLSGVDMGAAILRAISYQARVGVKLIVLDHLTAVSDTMELRAFNSFIRELYHTAGRHGVCILAVSHMSRDKNDKTDNEPSLARVKNSSAIAQWSTGVLGLCRERGSNRVKLSTLKQSRTWGITGDAWFLLNSDTMQLEECDAPPTQDEETNNDQEEW